jgi:two-component system, OmpR family, response regulator
MKKVMVVDDERSLAHLIVSFLKGAGYDVVYCANGAAAWKRLQKEKVDIAILDVNMPRMGGLELCQRIRTDFKLRSLPILMLTIRRKTREQVEGYESGADDYLAKPFEFSVLLARLQALERRTSSLMPG